MVLLDILGIGQDVLNRTALGFSIEDVTITVLVILLGTIVIVLTSGNERVTEVELVAQTFQRLPDITEVDVGVCIEVDVPLTALASWFTSRIGLKNKLSVYIG